MFLCDSLSGQWGEKMVSLIYILFICIVAPLILMLFLIPKESRITVGFMIIGIAMCVFAAEVNSIFASFVGKDMFFLTTTITPINEEIIKAIPILIFGFFISDDRKKILSTSMAVGIGFAILENATILTQNIDTVSVFWAVIRGFCAALMHGVCTSAVGYGVSFIKKKKKLFYTGTFGLLAAAIIFHAIYNALVQSPLQYIGFLLPILVYFPIVILTKKQGKTAERNIKTIQNTKK